MRIFVKSHPHIGIDFDLEVGVDTDKLINEVLDELSPYYNEDIESMDLWEQLTDLLDYVAKGSIDKARSVIDVYGFDICENPEDLDDILLSFKTIKEKGNESFVRLLNTDMGTRLVIGYFPGKNKIRVNVFNGDTNLLKLEVDATEFYEDARTIACTYLLYGKLVNGG